MGEGADIFYSTKCQKIRNEMSPNRRLVRYSLRWYSQRRSVENHRAERHSSVQELGIYRFTTTNHGSGHEIS